MSDAERLRSHEDIRKDAKQAENKNNLHWQLRLVIEATLLNYEETRQTNVLLSELLRRTGEYDQN